MDRIIKVDQYEVAISDHGVFTVSVTGLPHGPDEEPDRQLYRGSVRELGHGGIPR